MRHRGPELHAVRADIGRLGDVLEDLLAAAEPGDAATVHPPCDPLAVASDVVSSCGPAAEAAGVTLIVVDGTASSSLVPGPESALRRCLISLVDNGLRHTGAGGSVTLSITSRHRGKKAEVLIEVADTGSGIDSEVRDSLFARRSRGTDDPRDGRRRYGLGLALVADSVHRLGGSIDVTSGDAGTTFSVALPQVEPAGK